MTVELQNSLFKYFTETLSTIVKEAKRSGRFDEGILGLCISNISNISLVYLSIYNICNNRS